MKNFLKAIAIFTTNYVNISNYEFCENAVGKKAFGLLVILIANFLFHFTMQILLLIILCIFSIAIGIISMLSTITKAISDFWTMLKSYYVISLKLTKRIFKNEIN